jgi:hypothetical protein
VVVVAEPLRADPAAAAAEEACPDFARKATGGGGSIVDIESNGEAKQLALPASPSSLESIPLLDLELSSGSPPSSLGEPASL